MLLAIYVLESMALNDGTYKTLFSELKKYLSLKADYYKLTGVEKLSLLLSAIAVALIATVLVLIALFYLTSALQSYIGQMIGIPLSYVIIAVVYIVLGVLVVVFKKSLIVNPICRLVSKIFLDKK